MQIIQTIPVVSHSINSYNQLWRLPPLKLVLYLSCDTPFFPKVAFPRNSAALGTTLGRVDSTAQASLREYQYFDGRYFDMKIEPFVDELKAHKLSQAI